MDFAVPCGEEKDMVSVVEHVRRLCADIQVVHAPPRSGSVWHADIIIQTPPREGSVLHSDIIIQTPPREGSVLHADIIQTPPR